MTSKPVITTPISSPLDDLLPERRIRAHAKELGDGPGAEVSDLEPAGTGNRIRFENGAIYVGPETSPSWVHGDIAARYDSLGGGTGWLGLPITDETGTPDGRGRYNHFEGGSIYWTVTTGAFEVHGALRDKWASLGWERSFLGYPITDETDTPGGRFNRFEGGSVYWTPAAGPFELHTQSLPSSITAHGDIVFEGPVPVGGWVDIVVHSDGSFVFSGHLHDSGAPDYTDSVVSVVIAKSTGIAYLFPHNGKVGGLLSRTDDNWSDKGTRQELLDAWADLSAGYQVHFEAKVDWDPAGWVEIIKKAYPYVVMVVEML